MEAAMIPDFFMLQKWRKRGRRRRGKESNFGEAATASKLNKYILWREEFL